MNKEKFKLGILVRLLKYVLMSWPLFIIAVVMTLLSNQLALLGPKYSGRAIDAIALPTGVDLAEVGTNVVAMIVCYVFSAILSYLLSLVMINISQKVVYRMRKQLFEKLTTLPVSYFDTTATGDIISRISYDIDTVNSSLSHDLVQVMTSIYTVVGSLIFMWNISKPMIIIFVITVPVSILFTRYRSNKVRPMFKLRSQKLGELNGYAEEMLSGCRTIQAYHQEKEISNRFDSRNDDAMNAYYKAEYYAAAMGPSVNFINNLSISLVMILGGILYMYSSSGVIKNGSLFFISLGGVAQFVQYSRKFAGPINEFANILHEFQSAFSAAERIFRIIDEPAEPEDISDALSMGSVNGDVQLSNVKFGYDKNIEILHGISFNAKPGETVAIVGPTGAGKTTVINLLMRFYDISDGIVTVDGKNIYEVKREELRKSYTMVLQDTWLFHGTVFENIAYGKENATFDEVVRVAKAARIHNYIEHLPDGYNTILSDDGINISKGQKQLITIARAMLSSAPMLILDEATSNVDSRTEIKIQEALESLMKDRTCFVIAHRLSTIKNADNILVIDGGKIIEHGNHNELIKLGGFYCKLYNSQFD
ncbi:MAG: ABC transporter ATP-binding protein [Acutalibacteraceae bacterium]|nr:ABC transporter ATP-binding protein [Acutalibacteraceae bacterium]